MKRRLKIFLSLVIVLAVAGIGIFAYLYNNGLSGQYANSEAGEGKIKVACVGDCITYGHGISGWEENNYPAQLQKLLGDAYHVANFGSSGACVNPDGDQPYIGREVYQNGLDYEADVLVFMLGTNDAKPENWTNAEDFMKDYKELLDSYLTGANPPSKIYVALCAEAYFAQYPEKVQIIDVHTLTEAHPEWFAKDGIHPNNDGARAIAELVSEYILTF